MSDYIDLITGKPLELWAEQAMKDRASSKAGAVERAREVARDLRLRLSAMGINLTDDARTAINRAVRFAALPASEHGRDDLAWFSDQHRLSLEYYSPVYGDDDDQSREWRVSQESGSINDREWDIIGRGETAAQAISQARAALQPQSGEAGA